jgi:sterol desaturase/sphingolipid hydroxylase (fatty acid hydroxylase superfamily)
MIEQLANIQPLLLVFLLIVLYSIENIRPYLLRPLNRGCHDRRNFLLSLISFAVNVGIGLGVVTVVEWTGDHHWGLLNWINVPGTANIILGVVLMDLGDYLTHRLQHRVPLFWKFHRVHHSDPHLNTSTSLRFHPFDVVVAQGLSQAVVVLFMGISMTSFIIYGTLNLLLLVPQHSNVKLPGWLEKYGSWLLATPGWHKIHHSANQAQTDSHYSDVFTIWDRLFGTWHRVKPHEIRYGLDEFSEDRQHRVGYLLASPFKKLKKRIS